MSDHGVAHAEHASLAMLLRHNVDVVVRALGAGGTELSSPLSAIVATRTVAEVVEDVTRVLVADARRAGHTWTELGQLLRISRQAAQQRFGESAPDPAPSEDSRPARRAVEVVEQMRDGDLVGLTADWDETMHEHLDADQVARVWRRLARNAGPLRTIGRPSVVRSGPYRVVDVPLAFEHGPMRARVTFNRDDSIAGLLVLAPEPDRPPDTALPEAHDEAP